MGRNYSTAIFKDHRISAQHELVNDVYALIVLKEDNNNNNDDDEIRTALSPRIFNSFATLHNVYSISCLWGVICRSKL